MKRSVAALGRGISASVPEALRTRLAPATRYLNMLLIDHVWVRLFYTNRRRLGEGVWRSAQPLPYQIRRYGREGVRTILNLRGRSKTTTYEFEKAACAEAGITLVDLAMKSRAAPTPETIRALREAFLRSERPLLIHCKSGADRAGLASALFLHFDQGLPVGEAARQLSLRFGHIRQADTGVLDAFLERYLADTAKEPMDFMTWVETRYDREELQRSFSASGWASRLLRLLRRE